jgi:hypothetical protein
MKRVVLLALVSAVACVPAAWAGGKTKTTVTIDAVFLGSGQTHWSGDMKSARKACKLRRRVLIYRARPGADVKVGSTRSYKGMVDSGYYWTYFEEGAAPSGRYYAKVKPTDRCQGDRSESLRGPS